MPTKCIYFVVIHNSQIVAKVVIFILSQLGHLHMGSEMQDIGRTYFSSFTSCQIVALADLHQLEHLHLLLFVTTILVIALSMWNIFSMISIGITFDISRIQDKEGNLRRKELLTWLDQPFYSSDGHILIEKAEMSLHMAKITDTGKHCTYGISQF